MNQEEIRDALAAQFGPDVIMASSESAGQITVTVAADKILDVCRFLKTSPDLSFDFLSFVAGVDRFDKSPRFEVVYQLNSIKHRHRFRISALIDESDGSLPCIDSVVSIWPTADWHERETAEMFGMVFKNHPDPRKLILPDHWNVYPLRKEFPVIGSDEDTPDLPPTVGS